MFCTHTMISAFKTWKSKVKRKAQDKKKWRKKSGDTKIKKYSAITAGQ